MSTTGKRTHSFLTTGLSFPQSRNLSPSPVDFPPIFGTFGFHSRKPLVYETKQFTWENHATFPANRKIQAESKPIHKRKTKTFTYLKKNNMIN
jgi:hypothetical protein